jgi:polyhydroxyalkanoate synthesis regulator protein
MRQYMEQTLGGLFPFNPIEEMNKQNATLFESAIKMFAPFYTVPGGSGAADGAQPSEAAVSDLQDRINTMQQHLNEVTKKS